MYESSCSYQGALELKRGSGGTCPLGIKTEEFGSAADWPAYRFCNPSTFEQLKQSVEKAKAALQDRSGFLGTGSAFSDLYSGVSTPGRSPDLQDATRSESDTKRLGQGLDRAEKSSHLSSPKTYISETLSRTKCDTSYKGSWSTHPASQSQGYGANTLTGMTKASLDPHSHLRQPGKLRLLALTILFLLTIHLFIFLTVIRKKSTKPLRIPHLSVPKLEVSVDVHNLPASYLTPGLKNQNRYRDCAPFPKLEDLAFSNTLWQVFRTESGKFYLFNAYLDDRSGSFVRIIASFATFKAPGKVFCQLWYKGVAAPDTVQASGFIKLWREEWNQGTINPYLISCPAKNGTPSSVSLVEVPCERASNNLRVRYSKGVMKDFVVCVKGLMYPFQDEGLRLVEWIEMAKIMGADRIEIYNYHVHGNMAKILKHFKEEGILTITPVTIPGVGTNSALVQNKILKKKLINSVMQEVIHINDCLYKNLHTAKYIVVLDLDEMIVPSGGIWSTILPRLDYLNQDASIVARNVYFMPKIGSGLENSSIPFYLKMLQSVYRTNYSKQFTSVKGFHRVSKIISLHNHLSLTCFGQCTYGVMDTDVAVLHHFKDSCRQVPGSCNESDLVKDTMIWRFRDRLVEATTNTLIHLGFMKT